MRLQYRPYKAAVIIMLLAAIIAPANALPTPDSTAFASDPQDCAAAEKVKWSGYEAAVQNARESNRPALLFFWGEDCRKCEMLEQKGFNRPDIACYINRHFALARESGKARQDLVAQYRVSAYPTVWFLTPEGKEIDFFIGYVKPDRLLLILHYVGDGVYKVKSFADYEKEQTEKGK